MRKTRPGYAQERIAALETQLAGALEQNHVLQAANERLQRENRDRRLDLLKSGRHNRDLRDRNSAQDAQTTLRGRITLLEQENAALGKRLFRLQDATSGGRDERALFDRIEQLTHDLADSQAEVRRLQARVAHAELRARPQPIPHPEIAGLRYAITQPTPLDRDKRLLSRRVTELETRLAARVAYLETRVGWLEDETR